jgi:hypothetical protein
LGSAPQKHPFSVGLCASGVAEFFKMGGTIMSKNGIGGLYMGFGFKALHLGAYTHARTARTHARTHAHTHMGDLTICLNSGRAGGSGALLGALIPLFKQMML